VLGTREAQIILGAAVIDDVLAMLLLAAVAALSAGPAGGAGGPWSLLILLGQAVGFVLFVVLVGSRVFRQYSIQLERLRVENAPFAVALLLTLGLAALSGVIGLAAIIGAFLAGMVLVLKWLYRIWPERGEFGSHAVPPEGTRGEPVAAVEFANTWTRPPAIYRGRPPWTRARSPRKQPSAMRAGQEHHQARSNSLARARMSRAGLTPRPGI
jgi:Sodium/hydrogen exchanger family